MDDISRQTAPSARDAIPSSDLERHHAVLRYITRQRWYKSRKQAPQAAELLAVASCGGGVSWAVARLDYPDGITELYNLPFCVCRRSQVEPAAVLYEEGHGRVVADAVYHAGARRRLLAHMLAGKPQISAAGVWAPQCFSQAPVPDDDDEAGSYLVRGEQSNSSFIFASGLVVKCFRRLQAGENPDVELGHFLTVRKGLEQVPHLYARMRLQLLGRPGSRLPALACDAAMVQQLIPDATDGWVSALGGLDRWLKAPSDAAPEAPWQQEAFSLGQATRAVHEALADVDASGPIDFLPRPTTKADIAAWKAAASHQAEAACQALEQHRDALSPGARRLCDRLLRTYQQAGSHALLQSLLPPLADTSLPAKQSFPWGRCIRHHGDYHLGQVLQRSATQFVLLDFEGEPLRPLAERRRLHSPLRDVAGMLRSFHYAAHSAAAVSDRRDAAAVTTQWFLATQQQFLRGYQKSSAPQPIALLPRRPDRAAYLLALFTAEKAFYEVCYELAHRPDWVYLPLTALCATLPRETS